MKGLIISIFIVSLFVIGNGLPVAGPVVESVESKSSGSTESILFYGSKSETVVPSVDGVEGNSVVNDLVAAPVSSVGLDEISPVADKSKSPVVSNQDEISVDKLATVSTIISDSVPEKKVKKGKSDEGKSSTVQKVQKVESSEKVAEVPVASPSVAEVQTEAPSQYSAGVSEDSVAKNSPQVAPVADSVPVAVALAAPTIKVVPVKADEVKPEATAASASSSSSDISAYLAEPINQATKLLVDLEQQIKGYLNTDLKDDAASTLSPLSYGAGSEEPAIEPSSTDARQNEQIAGMVDQIEMTIHNLDQSIEDLMANRRYMTAAMMRSMRSYLRGVQNNLQRLQNRLRALQAVASSASAPPADDGSGTAGYPSNAFFESLRVRVNRITTDITNLMNRMRSTLVSSTTARPFSG
ncbi:uncharacterized protein LOC128394172 [Panonychus citri]|uniref:uncharacterized protein LOC128389245 n=1 Tax=Panonychus citri TaxID=50023 RepID=UPI002307C180|nr:uncharacterized protein LOC128389245 [Panonychus citri]XP_053210415.1 uncharacterized protein LOC128394172 [Panonychus citri]